MGYSRTFYGCLYGAEVNDSGVVTGLYERLGEAYPMSVKMTEEVVKIMGRTCLTKGLIVGSKGRPSDAGGSLTLFDYTAENVARAMKGEISTNAVSETTLTDTEVTLGGFGKFASIGTEDLSGVTVASASGGGGTTYVEGTDYEIDTVLGLIAAKSGGAIAENATVYVSGTGSANTDTKVTIGKGDFTKLALKGNLTDDFNGETVKLYLRMVKLISSNEVVLLSDESTDREQLDFEMVPEVPSGQSDYGFIDGLPLAAGA